MPNGSFRCCGNCKNCLPFESVYEYENDESGFCKANDYNVVFLDDDNCDMYVPLGKDDKRNGRY